MRAACAYPIFGIVVAVGLFVVINQPLLAVGAVGYYFYNKR